jgi:hypothetical protein
VLFVNYNYNDHVEECEMEVTYRKNCVRYRILVGKPEEKRPLIRSIRRCVDNIETNIRAIGRASMDCSHLAEDRDNSNDLRNTEMNL